MMIECPDYGDPILVPSGWYRHPESRQIIYHACEYGYEGDLMPVVLRGSRHCRTWKYRSHRDYGQVVLTRYLRMRRLTFVDISEWQKFWVDHLSSLAQKQPWWDRQRSLFTMFLYLVNEWRVLINGETVIITDKQQMANVKKIHGAMKRISAA